MPECFLYSFARCQSITVWHWQFCACKKIKSILGFLKHSSYLQNFPVARLFLSLFTSSVCASWWTTMVTVWSYQGWAGCDFDINQVTWTQTYLCGKADEWKLPLSFHQMSQFFTSWWQTWRKTPQRVLAILPFRNYLRKFGAHSKMDVSFRWMEFASECATRCRPLSQ